MNRQELYDYLNNFDFNEYKDNKYGGVYFLMKFGHMIEPIYFFHYEDAWFETDVGLDGYDCSGQDIHELICEYVEEIWRITYDEKPEDFYEAYKYEMSMVVDEYHYDLSHFQVTPFLPDEFEIIKPMTQRECLLYLIKQRKGDIND